MTDRGTADAPASGRRGPASLANGWILRVLIAANLALFLGYAIKGAILDYSFWIDELYSITASGRSVAEIVELTSTDVHPPTYYLSLKAWSLFFGQSELAARGLSFVYALLALVAFWQLRAALPTRAFLVSLALFTASYFLVFYAQEVRSYALILMLSTAALAFFLRDQHGRLIVAATLLGLVHFFGTLLGGLLLAHVLLTTGRTAYRLAALGGIVAMALWPGYQVLFGLIDDYTGGGFWIDTTPLGAVEKAVFTSFPVFEGVVLALDEIAPGAVAAAWLLFAAAALAMVVAAYRPRGTEDGPTRLLDRCLVLYGLVVAAVVVISFQVPVATKRNFIILVPLVAVILGIVIHRLLAQRGAARIAAIVVLVLLETGSVLAVVYKLENKHRPWEEWRAPAEYAFRTVERTRGSAYYFENDFGSAEWLGHVFRFYYPAPDRLAPLTLETVTSAGPGDVLVFGHEVCTSETPRSNRVIDRLERGSVPHRVVWFDQFLDCPNGVVIYE